ncbi:MAG: GNAT family N-acetyltransferase [Nocardioidaceae bacterium]
MTRFSLLVRDARIDDAPSLAAIWADSVSRNSVDRMARPDAEDIVELIERMAVVLHQRVIVAEIDGCLAGAAFLSRASLGPFHDEDAMYVSRLQVDPSRRRHGAGRALVEAAVAWAEELGVTTILAAAASNDREANRFLARLGFASSATIRAAQVNALRATTFPVEPPACARTARGSSRTVGAVLAQRRLRRRSGVASSGSETV